MEYCKVLFRDCDIAGVTIFDVQCYLCAITALSKARAGAGCGEYAIATKIPSSWRTIDDELQPARAAAGAARSADSLPQKPRT